MLNINCLNSSTILLCVILILMVVCLLKKPSLESFKDNRWCGVRCINSTKCKSSWCTRNCKNKCAKYKSTSDAAYCYTNKWGRIGCPKPCEVCPKPKVCPKPCEVCKTVENKNKKAAEIWKNYGHKEKCNVVMSRGGQHAYGSRHGPSEDEMEDICDEVNKTYDAGKDGDDGSFLSRTGEETGEVISSWKYNNELKKNPPPCVSYCNDLFPN
jgi:hypothetical protein